LFNNKENSMADNISVTEGLGKTIGADEISSVLYQRIKLIHGADGTNAGDVSDANPLPIDDAGGSITVDGTVAVTNAGITSIDGKITACNTGAVVVSSGAITETNSAAIKTAVEVIDNAISGSEMQVDVVAALPAGDNNIGNVDIASAIPAGTNNIGDVDVLSLSSGKTILRAVISGATSGNNTIVAAAGGALKIKVLSVCLVAAAAVTVRFESGADGTALTGVMSLDAKSGFVLNAPADPSCHWFETAANTLLNMELGGAVQVSGMITYYTEA
jgi:hypothetical protein